MTGHHIKQALLTLTTLMLAGMSVAAVFMMSQGTQFLSVQSGSMVPAYNKGDLVVVTRVSDGQLAVGDVVTFTSTAHHQSITHRIIELPSAENGGSFTTKGDANVTSDEPISASDIIGKVSYGVPYLGYFMDFVRQPIGLLLLIYVPALTIVGAELRRLAKYYKSQQPYVAPGCHSILGRQPNRRSHRRAALLVLVLPLLTAVPAYAVLMSSATLGANSIATFGPADHLLIYQVIFSEGSAGTCLPVGVNARIVNSAHRSSNEISVTGGCTVNTENTNNVNINNSTSQSSTSGDATSHDGGDATSGSANNGNSTSISITINNDNGTASSQAVVIYNPTSQAIDLRNWRISDNEASQLIPRGHSIAAKGYLILDLSTTGELSLAGDRLLLKNPDAVIVDALSWGSDISQLNPPVDTAAATKSLLRRGAGLDTDSASDWRLVR